MTRRDDYYNRAKQEGYRARSAYKLKQLDDEAGLLSSGDRVVDLGAAPGGWLQVAAERVGENGLVVGVDFQRIAPVERGDAPVETVRGDATDEDVQAEIRDLVGDADVVLSDMAPNLTGEYDLDQARSVHLARTAFETASEVLGPGGDFAAKVFEGRDFSEFRADLEGEFEYVRTVNPDASRDASSEVYLVGKGFLTAPVERGEELTVEIEGEGREGDGVARVEGFTLFVPDTDVGETVDVRVEDIKARFGFASRIDH